MIKIYTSIACYGSPLTIICNYFQIIFNYK